MANQYFIPGDGMTNATGQRQFFIPGDGMFDDRTTGANPPGEPSSELKLMRHGKYFASGEEQDFWWAR